MIFRILLLSLVVWIVIVLALCALGTRLQTLCTRRKAQLMNGEYL